MIPASLFSVQSRPARWPHTDCDVHCRPLQRLRCRCEIRRSRCVSCRAPASRPCSPCPCSSCPCSPCSCTSCPSPPWATWTGWLLGIKELLLCLHVNHNLIFLEYQSSITYRHYNSSHGTENKCYQAKSYSLWVMFSLALLRHRAHPGACLQLHSFRHLLFL